MRRSIQIALALLSIPLGLMFVSYLLDRRAEPDASPASPGISLEKSRNSVVPQAAPGQGMQRSREQEWAQGTKPDGYESAGNASYSMQVPAARRGMTVDPEPADSRDAIADTERVTDFSVVDQPFPVSGSIVEVCNPTKPGAYRRFSCDRVNELLLAMAREPRDEAWAAASEKLLRAYAEQEPGKFTIRALECRKTICFIETASIFALLREPDADFMRNHGFNLEYNPVDASETDGTGARLKISLLPFTRR